MAHYTYPDVEITAVEGGVRITLQNGQDRTTFDIPVTHVETFIEEIREGGQ